MNKTFLIGLSLLAIFALSLSMNLSMNRSFAGVAGPVHTPAWINCIGQSAYVQSTGKAYAGTSNVLVAWVAPSHDSQGIWGGCWNANFNEMEFTVQVYHAGIATATGPTFVSTSTYPPSGITVSLTHYVCGYRICYNEPYILKFGDGICVNELVFYGAVDYVGGYCYYV